MADFAAWASACGGFGAKVTKPGDLEAAIREALRLRRPGTGRRATSTRTSRRCPARSTYEQAKKFAEAFLKGQPHKAAIATTLFKDKIQQMRG